MSKKKSEREVTPPKPPPPAEELTTDAPAKETLEPKVDEAQALRSELEKLKNEMLRQRADFDNARKRIEKQKREEVKYSSLPLILDLLTVIDHLELALNYAPEDDPLRQGVNMALTDMEKVLKSYHLEKIESQGKKFDPSLHEALSITHDSEKEDNVIIVEQRAGYKLFDRVVRPSRVVVNRHPAVKTEEAVG